MEKSPSWHGSTLSRLRTYFLTGLVIAAPIAITLSIAIWFVRLFDDWFRPWLPMETYTLPGVGLVFTVLALICVGALAANMLGRRLLDYWDALLGRMPVIRSVYKALKQIFETAISPTGLAFQQVGMIEWPRAGLWTLVFLTRPVPQALAGAVGQKDMVAVYVPTTPNPTGGYMVFVRRRDLTILDMSVEEGMKTIVSLGLVMPEVKKAQPAPIRRTASSRSKR